MRTPRGVALLLQLVTLGVACSGAGSPDAATRVRGGATRVS